MRTRAHIQIHQNLKDSQGCLNDNDDRKQKPRPRKQKPRPRNTEIEKKEANKATSSSILKMNEQILCLVRSLYTKD